MATKIEIGDPANPAGADPENPANPQFALAMDLGNGRTMHTREMEATDDGDVVTEVVIVATDIEAPTDIPFIMADGKGRLTLLDANERR